MKILIIGGVAAGASAAARARRMAPEAEIVMVERGADPSFANCGLPYYIGGEIESRENLLVAPIETLRQRHRLDVRMRTEAQAIDRKQKRVHLQDLETGRAYAESYDKLILATGAKPFRPPVAGIDGPLILELRDLQDADRLHALATGSGKEAIVIGAGFIGIEVAENLVARGLHVTIVEMADQILTPWDREMVTSLHEHLRHEGVSLRLSESAVRFEHSDTRIRVHLKSGEIVAADFAVVCIGIRPENALAVDADLECGPRGGVVTNRHMQTNDPDIYAVGDVAQVQDPVFQQPTQIPLAGPANRQGRVAADHALGLDASYRGTLGTSVVGVFGRTAAMTGWSEKRLVAEQIPYEAIYVHPTHHAGYYPGAERMTLKLLFDPESGRVLGGQAVGGAGVDKRVDVLAMALQAEMTVFDLEEAELCYAPQYGSAKDPINMAGFVAANFLRGLHPLTHARADGLDPKTKTKTQGADRQTTVIDVRTPAEFAFGHVPGAINLPLDELRDRWDSLPKDQSLITYCQVGQRGYMATRFLQECGADVRNLSGGLLSWIAYHGNERLARSEETATSP